MRALALVGLAGCTAEEVVDPSWLDELQVIGVVLEPPSLGRVSSVEVSVTAVDPRERGAEVLVWSCTDFGVGCFEQTEVDGSPRPVSHWARAATLVADAATVSLPVPEFALIAPEEARRLDIVGLVWALACAPGVCDLIREVRADPEPGTAAWDRVARRLAHPEEWMAELQPGWASLAVKAIPVGSDNGNPELSGGPVRLEAPAGGSRSFQIRFEDDEEIERLHLATWSTLGPVTARRDPQGAVITWTAPEGASGTGRVYAVVSDGRGGQAVFAGDLSIVP